MNPYRRIPWLSGLTTLGGEATPVAGRGAEGSKARSTEAGFVRDLCRLEGLLNGVGEAASGHFHPDLVSDFLGSSEPFRFFSDKDSHGLCHRLAAIIVHRLLDHVDVAFDVRQLPLDHLIGGPRFAVQGSND